MSSSHMTKVHDESIVWVNSGSIVWCFCQDLLLQSDLKEKANHEKWFQTSGDTEKTRYWAVTILQKGATKTTNKKGNSNHPCATSAATIWHHLMILSTSRSLFLYMTVWYRLTFLLPETDKQKQKQTPETQASPQRCMPQSTRHTCWDHTHLGGETTSQRPTETRGWLSSPSYENSRWKSKRPHGGNENSVVFFSVCVMGNIYMFSKEWAIKCFLPSILVHLFAQETLFK